MNIFKRLMQPTPIFEFYRFRKQVEAELEGGVLSAFQLISNEVESMIVHEGFVSMRDHYLRDAKREGTPNALKTFYSVAIDGLLKKSEAQAPSPSSARDRKALLLRAYELTLNALCVMKGYGFESVPLEMAELMQQHLFDD